MPVRLPIVADLDAMVQIENLSFPKPWTINMLKTELISPWSVALVNEIEGTVSAFILCWKVVDELHILDLAVHPSHRRKGLGKALVQAVAAQESCRKVQHMILEVRRSNFAAQELYRALGFSVVGERPGYYDDEDALIMRARKTQGRWSWEEERSGKNQCS